MKTKKYWYCEVDRMGQRTGNYCSVELPECFVIKKDGFFYSAIDTVHNTGVIEKHTFLHTSETEAQRAALS